MLVLHGRGVIRNHVEKLVRVGAHKHYLGKAAFGRRFGEAPCQNAGERDFTAAGRRIDCEDGPFERKTMLSGARAGLPER
jgi:hypothetical protein